jgi:hypothetical protein
LRWTKIESCASRARSPSTYRSCSQPKFELLINLKTAKGARPPSARARSTLFNATPRSITRSIATAPRSIACCATHGPSKSSTQPQVFPHPVDVAACDCISQYLAMRNTCARVAICDTPPWDDSNSDMLKDLAAGCAARRRGVPTASNPAPQRRLFSRERATVCAGSILPWRSPVFC